MDATLGPLKSKAAEMLAESRVKADQFIADLRKKRNEFESASRSKPRGQSRLRNRKCAVGNQCRGFEGEIKKYLDTFGKDIKEQQAVLAQ
jgi:hypothetical protein